MQRVRDVTVINPEWDITPPLKAPGIYTEERTERFYEPEMTKDTKETALGRCTCVLTDTVTAGIRPAPLKADNLSSEAGKWP